MTDVQYQHTVQQLEMLGQKLDEAARQIVSESTARVTRYAQVNANSGAHKRGEGHIPGSGPGPNVVTGTLRRSIKPTPPIRTSTGWAGTAGPTVVYARAVELGHPNWPEGIRFPYLAPAIASWKSESVDLIRGILETQLTGV